MSLDSVSGDGGRELGESLDTSKSELGEAFSSWGETSGGQQEDLALDYSGCVWSSPVCEIPSWTESFKETVSEFDNDVCSVPSLSTPQKVVASNISTVEQGDINEAVPVAVPMSKVEVAPVIEFCNCCMCSEPVNVVLPVIECNKLDKESVESSNIPVITSNSASVVTGYFSGDSVSCHSHVVDSTKVTGKIKDRYKLPSVDPIFDPSTTCKTITEVEVMSYLLGVYVDIIPRDLADLWSQIIGRSVQAPERFGITSLTQQEMLHLKKKFMSEQSDKSDIKKKITSQGKQESVSSCMSSSLISHHALPYVALVVEQIGLKNLKVDKALVDTGSQISLVSMAYLVRHKLDLRSIIPLSVPCSLKSATGRMMNPFKGKITLNLRFCTMQNRLTRNVKTEFHVLENSAQLENLLLGLNFIIPSAAVIEFKYMTMCLKFGKRFHKLTLLDESKMKVYFYATEDGAAGTNMVICRCSRIILEDGFYKVPDLYQQMLGSDNIFLQPGSARKLTKNGDFSQQYIFEIMFSDNFNVGDILFYLEGPQQQSHKSSEVNYSYLERNYSQDNTNKERHRHSHNDNHHDYYKSLFAIHAYWLNHPKSFIYNKSHRGLNKLESTISFPMYGHSDHVLNTLGNFTLDGAYGGQGARSGRKFGPSPVPLGQTRLCSEPT